MAKVTVIDADAYEAVPAAPGTARVVGPSGRVYKLKKLSPIERMLVFDAIGAEASQNVPFLNYSLFAYSVRAIDDDLSLQRNSKSAIMAIVKRIGNDWDAVQEALYRLNNPAEDESDDGDDDEKAEKALKAEKAFVKN